MGQPAVSSIISHESYLLPCIPSGGSDYQYSGRRIFTFCSALNIFSVAVPLLNDDISESTESFSASLSFVGAPPPNFTINPATADIEILDNDGKEV